MNVGKTSLQIPRCQWAYF